MKFRKTNNVAVTACRCLSDSRFTLAAPGFPNWVKCDSLSLIAVDMGKAHPIELRTRVVAFADEGHGHREAARHFRVSPKFVNDLIKLRQETGALEPRPQGKGGGRDRVDRIAWRGPSWYHT